MKRWTVIVLLAGMLGAAGYDAWAHGGQPRPHRQYHHRSHVRPLPGIVVVPAIVPRFYYYAPLPYPSSPPPYGTPPATGAAQSYAPGPPEYQYFCPDSRLYYPAVLECPSGWLAVVPGVGGPPSVPRN